MISFTELVIVRLAKVLTPFTLQLHLRSLEQPLGGRTAGAISGGTGTATGNIRPVCASTRNAFNGATVVISHARAENRIAPDLSRSQGQGAQPAQEVPHLGANAQGGALVPRGANVQGPEHGVEACVLGDAASRPPVRVLEEGVMPGHATPLVHALAVVGERGGLQGGTGLL